MVGPGLSTTRSISNTPAEHVADHNTIHQVVDLLDLTIPPVMQGTLVFNVKAAPYNATGDGTTDDTAAIQAAIDAAKVAATNRGAVVFFPAGSYLVSAPLILPRTGTTPINAVALRGASVRTAYLLASGGFATNRAVIEWEATTARAWHQEITDLQIRPASVAGCRAVHYKKNAAGTTLTDFNNERMQITMRDVLIEGNNGFHTSLIKLEGQVFFSTFDRVYGDNAVSSLIGSYQPTTDYDTLLFEFESGLFGGAVSDDITGLSYSTIRNCVAGSLRRGGRGALLKGRAIRGHIQNCWVDGTRYDNGLYLLNSFAVTVTAVNNEGRSGTPIYIQDSVGITLERVAFANQDPEFPDWAASTAYTTNVGVVVPGWRSNLTGAAPANNLWYQCTTAGTTAGSQPTWPTTPTATVADGSVVWTCVGPAVSDAVIIDGGSDITLRTFACDSVKGTTTSRGYKALRLKNAPVNVRADSYTVPGDPASDVAWVDASGVGIFRGARVGEKVTIGADPFDANRAARSGFYRQSKGGTATTRTLTQDTEYAVPIEIVPGATLDRLAINVTTAVASGVIRLGVRADSGGYPSSTVLLDAGTVNAATTGIKELTVSVVTTGQRVWLTATAQVVTGLVVTGLNGPIFPIEHNSNASAATSVLAAYLQTGVTGALGAFSAAVNTASSGPLIAARMA